MPAVQLPAGEVLTVHTPDGSKVEYKPGKGGWVEVDARHLASVLSACPAAKIAGTVDRPEAPAGQPAENLPQPR